jgi:peptidoglycan/xylan/chitin deacetylase (PgdA/CDA1 family)
VVPATIDDVGRAGATPLLLTFDDGGRCAARIADALEQRGWCGHFFITTARIGEPAFLARGAIRDLRRRGHVIGSHSHTHPPRLSHCADAQLHVEWTRSFAILGDVLGEAVVCASVPGGYHSNRVARSAAAAGARFLFTSQPTTRAHRVGGMWVVGRFVVKRSTTAAAAAAIAAGDLAPRVWQAAVWDVKEACKRLGGTHYLRIRARILAQDGAGVPAIWENGGPSARPPE